VFVVYCNGNQVRTRLIDEGMRLVAAKVSMRGMRGVYFMASAEGSCRVFKD
jgi:hypothetical protein